MMEKAQTPLVEVKNLSITFYQGGNRTKTIYQGGKRTKAVKRASFTINEGEAVALVGESGSGKTLSALSLLRLLPKSAKVKADLIAFAGRDITKAKPNEMLSLRGEAIGVIFQEPMTALNPLHTVGRQIDEALLLHQKMTKAERRIRAIELLEKVQIADPERRLSDYPHQLSGGQRQRVMIAIALANNPKLLIADEPTTALDVTIQAEILDLLKTLQLTEKMALLLISHDLSIVRHMASRVLIMKNGKIIESASTEQIFTQPQEDYTRELISADALEPREHADFHDIVMRGMDLKVHFPIKRGPMRQTVDHIKAVDNVNFVIHQGETLGIVGESGSGKTTLIQALLRLNESSGQILLGEDDLNLVDKARLRELRGQIQIVFQDPFGSLSPRMSVGEIIAEGLTIHFPELGPDERTERVAAIMKEVDLDPAWAVRYPHEFSGGQRQRIAIARAVILEPKLIFLDEPTSALDKTVQRKVIDLLRGLQERRRIGFIFVSHDLRVVRAMSHRLMVMFQGKVVEQGQTENLFNSPQHPYTQKLLAAALNL